MFLRLYKHFAFPEDLHDRLRWLVRYPQDFLLVILMGVVTLYLGLQPFMWPQSHDILLYTRYAENFLRYHHFAPEYPPLAMGIFLVTQIYSRDPYLIFGIAMITAIVVVSRIALVVTSGRRVLVVVGYTMLGMMRRHQWQWAYLILGVGALVKLYPIFLMPIVLIEQWQMLGDARVSTRIATLGKALVPTITFASVVMGVAWLMSPTTIWHFLSAASARPTQIEAVGGSIIWLWASLHGAIPAIVHTYSSSNMAGSVSTALARGSVYFTLLGVGILYLRQYQHKTTAASTFLGVVGVIVLTSKVFSTQYLIWLLPLVGELVGLDIIWIAICVLTSYDAMIYPFFSSIPPPFIRIEGFFFVVFLRNILLVIAIVRVCSRHIAQGEEAQPSGVFRTTLLPRSSRIELSQ